VTRKMGIRWQLRLRMAEKGMFQTSDQWAKRDFAAYAAERSASSRNTVGQPSGDLHPAGLLPVVACGYERGTGPDGKPSRTSP
jgi:hypothetical protein